MSLKTTLLLIPLLPLAAAVIAGLLRKQVGRAGSHWVAILGRCGIVFPFCLGALPTGVRRSGHTEPQRVHLDGI